MKLSEKMYKNERKIEKIFVKAKIFYYFSFLRSILVGNKNMNIVIMIK